MILQSVTLNLGYGFVEWFELEAQISHLLVRYWSHQIGKEVPISAGILKHPNRMTWIPSIKKFLTVNPSCLYLLNLRTKVCHPV